jgi:hypothetical protein
VIQRNVRPEAEVVDISQNTQSQNTEKMSSVVPGVSSIANSHSSDNDDDADDYIDSSEKYNHGNQDIERQAIATNTCHKSDVDMAVLLTLNLL